MRLPWWTLLVSLRFLRFNLRHFSTGSFPTITEGDSLLAEHLDALVVATRLLSEAAGEDGAALHALRDVFS